MLRILHTGDLHLGREYKNADPAVAARYRQARLEALGNILLIAAEKDCDYVLIAGDLFDSHNPPAALIKTVCDALARCACPVLVLPGNHDYCQEEDRLWTKFRDCADDTKVILMDECRTYTMSDAVFYACPCPSRTSEENMLSWLKQDRERSVHLPNIGVAHGAIEGLSCDREQRYFYMGMRELEDLGMDLWLIGHTHVPYPQGDVFQGQRVFNAGTHQQTDIADNSEGSVFLIDIAEDRTVTAQKIHTGVISFVRKELQLSHGQSLAAALETAVKDLDGPNTSLRLFLSGTASEEDYIGRFNIYDEVGGPFLNFDVRDSDLQPEITAEMIDAETAEGTPENQLLKGYLDDPELLNLAFDLVRACKKGE